MKPPASPRHSKLPWRLCLFLIVLSVGRQCHGQITLGFPEKHQVVVLHVPGKPAALQVDVLHLRIEDKSLSKDLTARRLRAEGGRGWILTAFVTPNRDRRLDARGFREYTWQELRKAPVQRRQMKTYERGEMAIREYRVEFFQGHPVHALNVFGYLVSGDLWFDVHISKTDFSPDDQALLNRFLDGIRVIEHYEPDSKEQFGYGSIFYLLKDWNRAAQHYEAALALEKRQRRLSRNEWRVLVDNLGMAYAEGGDLERARPVFEYGLSQESGYPMFHYNLACYYAETKDLRTALEHLRTAFHYRENGIPGEGMPDPRRDLSFKNYVKDPDFTKLADAVCPSSRSTARGYMCQP